MEKEDRISLFIRRRSKNPLKGRTLFFIGTKEYGVFLKLYMNMSKHEDVSRMFDLAEILQKNLYLFDKEMPSHSTQAIFGKMKEAPYFCISCQKTFEYYL